MNNEKQQKILQMAKDICRVKHICNDVCNPISACDALKYAERAIEAGYCKQSEGEWEARTDAPGFVRCSVCKDCNVYDEWADGKKWRYCPNCGAKMKGGE